MASSKVMASRSPPNPDRPRHQPSINLQPDHSRGGLGGSMNMDDLFRNIYPDTDTGSFNGGGDAPGSGKGGSSAPEIGGLRNGNGGNTVEEVWREIVSGGANAAAAASSGEPAMTLEDFLAKAGAVNEEDVRVPAVVTMPPPTTGGYGIESAMMNPGAVQFPAAICVQNGYGVEFGNGISSAGGSSSGGGSGRVKRRSAVEEAPLDKATQQKQRRMIKNRESAARSRERKQAYTVELESMVAQLEEDNARLIREEAELKRERYKQLMEKVIPVEEKQRPRKLLRRTLSLEW